MNEKKTYSYGKIRHFTDIEAWKRARELRNELYGIVKKLPSEEKYDLGSHKKYESVFELSQIAIKLLNGYIRYLQRQREKTKEVANY